MYENGRKVLVKNLKLIPESERHAYRRQAFKTLFDWYGASIVQKLKEDMWACRGRDALRALILLSPFVIPIFQDFSLFRSFLDTLCGKTMRKMFKGAM
jgi:hypothetical protein